MNQTQRPGTKIEPAVSSEMYIFVCNETFFLHPIPDGCNLPLRSNIARPKSIGFGHCVFLRLLRGVEAVAGIKKAGSKSVLIAGSHNLHEFKI